MYAYFGILSSILLLVTFVSAQTKKSGEDIADALYKHANECKDPNDGGIWAPLAAGQSCGEHDCKYPDEWCSARSSSRSVPQFNCVKLSEDCKRALAKDDGVEYKPSSSKPADKPVTKTTQSASSKSTLKPSTSSKSAAAASKTTLKPTKSAPSTTLKPKTVGGFYSENSEKSGAKSTTQASADASEVTTLEAKTEVTTPGGGSSEEEVTTVRTRRPNRFRGRPGEEKPRKEEKEGGAGSEVAPSTQKPADDCKDSSPLCCFWASNINQFGSECDRNALWMRVNCQRSCGTCGCQVSNFQSCQVKVNTDNCPFLQGPSSNLVFIPVQSQGGPFSFPTAGGNAGLTAGAGGAGGAGNVAVPVGSGLDNGGFGQQSPNFQIQNPNPSLRFQQNFGQSQRISVPLGAGKR